jgi:hypothetical protein
MHNLQNSNLDCHQTVGLSLLPFSQALQFLLSAASFLIQSDQASSALKIRSRRRTYQLQYWGATSLLDSGCGQNFELGGCKGANAADYCVRKSRYVYFGFELCVSVSPDFQSVYFHFHFWQTPRMAS